MQTQQQDFDNSFSMPEILGNVRINRNVFNLFKDYLNNIGEDNPELSQTEVQKVQEQIIHFLGRVIDDWNDALATDTANGRNISQFQDSEPHIMKFPEKYFAYRFSRRVVKYELDLNQRERQNPNSCEDSTLYSISNFERYLSRELLQLKGILEDRQRFNRYRNSVRRLQRIISKH